MPTVPLKEAVLSGFGGLYVESDSRAIPAGASPLCYDCDFDIGSVTIRPGLTTPLTVPPGTPGYQWLKSAALPGTLRYNIFNDTIGNLWYENLSSPGVMTKFYAGILNNARAISASFPQREFIALSTNGVGSDQPRQWDGTNLDRVSQVGPGAGPTVPPQAAPATYGVASIVQPYAAQTINSAVWGAFINEYNAPPAANSLWILGAAGAGAAWLGDVEIGDYIYISGVGNLEGQNPNGTYAVAGTGFYTDNTGVKPYILVQTQIAVSDFARGTAGGTYQKTQAVLNITNQIPSQSAAIGGTLTIAGASPISWNALWTIINTPTLGQLLIQATSLISNVATYTYSLASGEAPGWQESNRYALSSQIVDQYGHVWQVTIPGISGSGSAPFPGSPGGPVTDNGVTWVYQAGATISVTVFGTSNGNGVFNIANQVITSATSTTFTVAIASMNFVASSEEGSAISGSANIIVIDPGTKTISTGSPGEDPIYGSASAGGLVIPSSTGTVASGQRYAVLMFLTRNNLITPASPPTSFYTTGQSTQITFNDLPVGPPDVIARIVAITAANSQIGGPYFWIPTDVTVPGTAATLGVDTTYSSTVLNDNVSTTLGPITLSDTVLLDGINISETGNNLFNQREIGEYVKCVNYFGRNFVIGERVKVDDFMNMTFDGGVQNNLPAGWNVTGSLASDVSVVTSPIVNTALSITNTATSKIVQSATVNSPDVSAITAVLPSVPTVGNTLVFFLCGGGNSGSYPSQSGLVTQTAQTEGGSPNLNLGVFTRVVQGGDGASWTLTFSGVATGISSLTIYEIQGTPTFMAASGSNPSSANPLGTVSVSPSTSSIVFGMFFWLNGSYPATSVSPSQYSIIQNYLNPSFLNNVAIVSAQGVGLSSSPIYLTLGASSALTAYFATLLCSYSGGAVINPTGTTLANMATLSQDAFQDIFGVPIIDTYTAYSVRVTVSATVGTRTASLVIELYSPSLGQNWPVTIPFSSIPSTVAEFILQFNNPLWQPVPSDLLLRVYPFNMPTGDEILIDRIEVFPTNEPAYTTQCNVSYAQNYEAVDAITGIIDTSIFTSETQTDLYVYDESLYIKTASKTFSVSGAQQSGEPSTWTVREVSNTVGECGPLASDVGEEYSLDAAKTGVYIFDGGNHTKISQEIYKIWNLIYQPAISTVWVKNDITNKRIMVGVPLPTPNKWLPNAPANSTPSSPNVVLMCRYTGLDTGPQIAEGVAVTVSMFGGHLIYKDGRRKWTIWQIASPYGDFIPRADGSNQFLFGGAVGTGEIYQLTEGVINDAGSVIDQTYMTYGFADQTTEEQLGIGAVRKLYAYGTADIAGAGNFDVTFCLEKPDYPYPNSQDNFPLYNPSQDDTNIPMNETGNALFNEFQVDGVLGSWFSLQRFVLQVGRDPWIPVSGR